jgi:HEPN family protein
VRSHEWTVNYEDELLSFVKRTRKNLELTEQWRIEHPHADFNEVTHLINSLLGLVVLPKEKVLSELQQLDVTPTGIPDWRATFRLVQAEGEPPTELRPFIDGLRNSVADGSLDFETDGVEITGVTFVQKSRDKPRRTLWRASFALDELRFFLEHFIAQIETACARRTKRARLAASNSHAAPI